MYCVTYISVIETHTHSVISVHSFITRMHALKLCQRTNKCESRPQNFTILSQTWHQFQHCQECLWPTLDLLLLWSTCRQPEMKMPAVGNRTSIDSVTYCIRMWHTCLYRLKFISCMSRWLILFTHCVCVLCWFIWWSPMCLRPGPWGYCSFNGYWTAEYFHTIYVIM